MNENDIARFLPKVEVRGPDECWPTRYKPNRRGYTVIKLSSGKNVKTYRFAYELAFGPVPPGLTVDHVCHNRDDTCPGGDTCLHRNCVNPTHLEAVPGPENTRRGKGPSATNRRKTHCVHGHEFTPDNTIVRSNGYRQCRTCAGLNPHSQTKQYGALTHCPHGHPYDEYGVINSKGYVYCSECMRSARRKSRQRLRSEAEANRGQPS